MLRYGKDAQISFSGNAQQNVDDIFAMANKCRSWYEPIFANESKYLPNQNREPQVPLSFKDTENKEQQVVMVKKLADQQAPKAPEKVEDNMLLQALLVGAGFFVLYKLLS
jgi:hypothetical protein